MRLPVPIDCLQHVMQGRHKIAMFESPVWQALYECRCHSLVRSWNLALLLRLHQPLHQDAAMPWQPLLTIAAAAAAAFNPCGRATHMLRALSTPPHPTTCFCSFAARLVTAPCLCIRPHPYIGSGQMYLSLLLLLLLLLPRPNPVGQTLHMLHAHSAPPRPTTHLVLKLSFLVALPSKARPCSCCSIVQLQIHHQIRSRQPCVWRFAPRSIHACKPLGS
jgi:hypothetical protein